MLYWDTSALVKLYVPEIDSDDFAELSATSAGRIYSASIASVEILTTLYRKESDGDLRAGGAATAFDRFERSCDAGQIRLVPFDGDVLEFARTVVSAGYKEARPVMLRALDTIHVASALAVRAEAIVTTDSRMREVAANAGLRLAP